MDLSIIHEIKSNFKYINETCNSSNLLQYLHKNLFSTDMKWNKNKNDQIPDRNLIFLEPYNIKILKSDYLNFKNRNTTKLKCELLSSLTAQLHMLNNEFDGLEKHDYATLSNIVPMEKILQHTFNYTSTTNLTNALNFSHWFNTNFFKYTKITLTIGSNHAFLTIKIPLFITSTLYQIYPKPIFYNNFPYIFNTQSKFLVGGQMSLNYFSNLSENCFYANNKTFCRKPKVQTDCDSLYIGHSTDKFDKNCFSRLKFENTVTRVQNNIYFLIFEPMTINMTCHGMDQSVRITQSSKILNNDCFIRSSFFEINPNSSVEHEMFFSNSTKNFIEWNLFFNPETKDTLQVFCLLVVLSIYLFISYTIMICHFRKNSNTPPPSYLESLV